MNLDKKKWNRRAFVKAAVAAGAVAAIGSTMKPALRALAQTGKPVLFSRASVLGPKVGEGEIFSKILIPLDGSEIDEAALPYIKGLTNKLESEVTFLRVVAPG